MEVGKTRKYIVYLRANQKQGSSSHRVYACIGGMKKRFPQTGPRDRGKKTVHIVSDWNPDSDSFDIVTVTVMLFPLPLSLTGREVSLLFIMSIPVAPGCKSNQEIL